MDLIERQKAIEAVEHITSTMSVCVSTDECHGMKRMQRQAVIELANLPSAQPESLVNESRTLVNDLVNDTISRQAAIDVAENAFVRGLLASPDIRRLPSAQPEIIRCECCKYFRHTSIANICGDGNILDPKKSDYCSRAERRTDGSD